MFSHQVYSFGVLLWELYMGKPPFGGMTQSQVGGDLTAGYYLRWGVIEKPGTRVGGDPASM